MTYKEAEKLRCLPIYIHRTTGEKELAYQASTKDTLKEAFKFLQELIDGPICRFQLSEEFFSLRPANQSMDAIRSYYFELYEISKAAAIPTDIFVMRFLTHITGGKRLFNSFKDDIKAELGDEGVSALYKKMIEKMNKITSGEQSPAVKEELAFVFNYDQTESSSARCEEIPQWARENQNELSSIKSRMSSSESVYDDPQDEMEAYPMQSFKQQRGGNSKKQGVRTSSGKKPCLVCNKLGHFARDCFHRKCFNCDGKGHDAKDCPSKGHNGGQPKGEKRNR